jgi:hypothetical protein
VSRSPAEYEEHAVRANGLRESFRANRRRGLGYDRVAHEAERHRPDEGFLGTRDLLESGGEVDSVASDERLTRGEVASNDLTGLDPDPDADRLTTVAYELLVQRLDGLVQLESCRDCSDRVVLVGLWDPEDRENGVADELLEQATVSLDYVTGGLEEARDHRSDGLRVETASEFGRTDDVGEEHRHEPSGCPGRDARRQRATAPLTESRSLRVGFATLRAHTHAGRVCAGLDTRQPETRLRRRDQSIRRWPTTPLGLP